MNILIFSDIDYLGITLSNTRLQVIQRLCKYWDTKKDITYNLIKQEPPLDHYNKPLKYFIDKYSPDRKVDLVVFYICVKFTHEYKMVSKCSEYDMPKVLHVEDMHHVEEIDRFIKYHNIDNIVYNYDKNVLFYELKNSLDHNIKWHHNELSIDIEDFKEYDEFTKKYDIILYGCNHKDQYPFRHRLYKMLKKSGQFNIKHIVFYTWMRKDYSIFGDILAHNINFAHIGIVTMSKYGYFLKKYMEIPACNVMIAGEVPFCYKNIYKDMIKLSPEMSDQQIIDTLKNALKNKKLLKTKTKKMCDKVREKFSIKQNCINLTKIYLDIMRK